MKKKVYLTVDVECHDIEHRNQYIDGKCKAGTYGLEKILILGKELNIPINFFFDMVEAFEYGDEYSKEIIDLIHSYGQKVYLHLHPDYISHNHERSFLWQYTYEEKLNILKLGFDYYERVLGHQTIAFRIGRYGADCEMYEIMNKLGINTIDLSYSYQNSKMCHMGEGDIDSINLCKIYEKQMIFPNTRYLAFDFMGKKKFINIDTNDTTINELRRFLRETNLSQIICTMHSWNFIKKYFFSKTYVGADLKAEKKFKKMVSIIKRSGYEFADLEESPPQLVIENDQVINLCAGISGKLQMLANNFIRFYKISRLNIKYFLFYSMLYILVLFLIFICLFWKFI